MTFQFDATRAGFEFDAHALADHAWSVAQRATIATLQAFYAEIERGPPMRWAWLGKRTRRISTPAGGRIWRELEMGGS
jgi:hypothetical protein